MHKLIVTLTNSEHPLEENILEKPLSKEFMVYDIHDTEEILNKAEPWVIEVRKGHENTSLSMTVKAENGSTVLSGHIKEGFHGVSFS